jgi:aminoglycoside phosphotransferase family enzyme
MDDLTTGTLADDLCRPVCYPAPRPAAVERRETHISWVFLAGDTAWKVKRPVALGFLDFRDLDQRRHFCQEEVRLNRRLAPDVYQAVVPIRRSRTGHTLDPDQHDGPIVDYAVKMRRLPDAASYRSSSFLWRVSLTRGLFDHKDYKWPQRNPDVLFEKEVAAGLLQHRQN